MLRGSYTAHIDEKGRVKIPAAFKRYLDETYKRPELYVTSLNGECAIIYPLSEWETIESKLALLPTMDSSKRKFLDWANYYGQLQQIDGQGRVLIHPQVRGAAELLGEVMVFGYLSYLEIWSADRFRKTRLSEPYTDADADALARLGI
jgi:MraZ protein